MNKAATQADLEAAEAKVARLTAKAEALSGYVKAREIDDPGGLSGIRRKPNHKADRARYNSYSREADAWTAVKDAEYEASVIRGRLATQARNNAIAFTEDQYKAAKVVRDSHGWHKVAKVNAKSVSVETGYSWTDRIRRDKIIEVR
jgi:hypothetical protein